ncbi:MAG: class I SAM-dependent methyltransferase [Rhodospirillaceae bacterium]
MGSDCRALVVERIRRRGPITVAEFMDLALYAPEVGYYARAAQRSGRTGDFFTSVDVGPVFGAVLAERFAAWWRSMGGAAAGPRRFDLVEAAAGNGRLTRDILDAAAQRDPEFYGAVAAHLVERSARARATHPEVLASHGPRLASSGEALPDGIEGIIFANELLDALPVHLVEMGGSGLAEIYVDVESGRLVDRPGPPSSPALARYLADAGVSLDRGARAELNLAAVAWVADAAARLRRGFLVLIDYGYEAAELYSAARSRGTLATFHRHRLAAPAGEASAGRAWLADPGGRDLTSHVDFTSVRRAAERAGLETVAITPQTRFLLEALEGSPLVGEFSAPDRLADRLALKTLLMPGGLGSTHSVLVFAKR